MSSSPEQLPIDSTPETAHKRPGACPGCGQHIDPVTRRCPRCRLWLLPLPSPAPRRADMTRAAGIAALALVSALVGLVLYVLLSNEPVDVVLPEAAVAVTDR